MAVFYIHRLSNDMKIAVEKNHLRGHIFTAVWTLLKTASKALQSAQKENNLLEQKIRQLKIQNEQHVGNEISCGNYL